MLMCGFAYDRRGVIFDRNSLLFRPIIRSSRIGDKERKLVSGPEEGGMIRCGRGTYSTFFPALLYVY